MGKDLTPEEVQALIAQDDKPKPRSKKTKFDSSDRANTNWFRLMHAFGECSNENCESPEEKGGRNRMVAEVDGIIMCRICFVGGYKGE